MILLILGALVWSGVHLFPSVAVPARARLIESLGGEKNYQGVFALALIVALLLMVFGWRSTPASVVYQPPGWGILFAELAVFVGLLLFAASAMATNIKRIIRHPQLTGVAVWAGAHLLSNGHQRSLILFGALFLWALAEIVLISRREGAWEKPEALPLAGDLKPLLAAAVTYAVLFFLHPYYTGVSP